MSEFIFWRSVENAASREALASPLPGYFDGPADAYRHIVGAAELRRRFGFGIAWAIVTANEVRGTHFAGHPGDLRRMDDHNNAIGLAIGADARSYEDVVRRAREAIERGAAQGGTGSNDVPMWRPSGWGEPRGRPRIERNLPPAWPETIPSAADYDFGAERFSVRYTERAGTPRQREAALLERLDATPTEEWSEADVRGVIGSTPYLNTWAVGHSVWRSRVHQYFETRTRSHGRSEGAARSARDDGDCGGVAEVRAYTRMGPSGPVQVSAHSRIVSCD